MMQNGTEELERQLKVYVPYNEQEQKDRQLILQCLKGMPDIFTRQNRIAHMTASAWVINQNRSKVLMAYHNLYDSWAWLGGHADGETDLLGVALREVREESGLVRVEPVCSRIFSLECLTVDGHWKRGEYVSSHLHLNVTYLLKAREEDPLHRNPDENRAVAWFTLQDAVNASTEPWFQEHIYRKLNRKLSERSDVR